MNARNTVKYRLDPGNPAPMTDEQKLRLAVIAAMPDSAIDYSDIPRQITPVQWSRLGMMLPSENKQQITLRVDADVLSFSKAQANAIKAGSMRRCVNMSMHIEPNWN